MLLLGLDDTVLVLAGLRVGAVTRWQVHSEINGRFDVRSPSAQIIRISVTKIPAPKGRFKNL